MSKYSPSETFQSAAAYLSNAPSLSTVDNATKLQLYGLFKFITVSTTPNTSRPYLFDITGRAKWDAWNEISKKFVTGGPEEAEQHYINIAKGLGWEKDKKATDTPEERDEDTTKVEKGKGGGGLGVSVSIMKAPEFHGADIHSLAISGDAQKMRQLLESGDSTIDINERDEYGYTPLHLSCDRGHVEIVKLLLEHKADTSIRDPDDMTAGELAEIAENETIMGLLKR